MTEATERIKKLYGPPASNEQIKLYFETLLRTYIEAAEKHLVETRSKFKWYSNRPLKFLFYANPTTVCFSLIGNADKEGAEEVKDVSLFSSSLKNGTSATFPIYHINKHSTPPHQESRPFYISI